jgi:hypothetical protein
MMKSDLPLLEPAYVQHVMREYIKGTVLSVNLSNSDVGSTKYREEPLILWPEFSTNFNSFWTRRMDVYELWMQTKSPTKRSVTLPLQSQRLLAEMNVDGKSGPNASVGNKDEYAAVRVMEAEMAELSERLRSTRQQLDEERQRRHQMRDDLDDTRRQLEDERNKLRDTTKQMITLEEDKMVHNVQVSRLREQIEQTMSLKESLVLDLERSRMQLFNTKEKYETALASLNADNEALRKKVELLQVELQQSQSGGANKRDLIELEAQNAVLRQVVDRYRRSVPYSSFNDSVDGASKAALDTPQLLSQTDFVNALMEALDKTKFLNKQMVAGSDSTSNWSRQSWQDLCVGWREAVCELCDLFASAHRIESLAPGGTRFAPRTS